MNREEILRMAREQGLPETEVEGVFRVNTDDLGRLLAAENEACAKVVEQYTGAWSDEGYALAATIRARGESIIKALYKLWWCKRQGWKCIKLKYRP